MAYFTVAIKVLQVGRIIKKIITRRNWNHVGITITRLLESLFKTEKCSKQNLLALLDLNRQIVLPVIVIGDWPPNISDEQRKPEKSGSREGPGDDLYSAATCFAAKQINK